MGLQLVIVGAKERAIITKIVEHAAKRENWYNPQAPGFMNKIPGWNKKHICKLGTHRCVFSWTIHQQMGRVYRHLSISIRQKERAPDPHAVKFIARQFGFTGYETDEAALAAPLEEFPPSWVIATHFDHPVDDPCIVLGEDVGIDLSAG